MSGMPEVSFVVHAGGEVAVAASGSTRVSSDFLADLSREYVNIASAYGFPVPDDHHEDWFKKDPYSLYYVERVFENVVKNPNTPIATLYELLQFGKSDAMHNKASTIVWNIAEHATNAPESLLGLLATDKDQYIRLHLADRVFDLPDSILEVLAEDLEGNIRSHIASRSDISDSMIRTFSSDQDERVIRSIASNPLTPADVLKDIYDTKAYGHGVLWALADNPNLPDTLIEELVVIGMRENFEILVRLSNNHRTPKEALMFVAQSGDRGGFKNLIRNPNTDKEALKLIASSQMALSKEDSELLASRLVDEIF